MNSDSHDTILSPDAPEWWSGDEYATPPAIVAALEKEFGAFTLDPCARAESAKAPRFFTKEQDGLIRPWTAARVWLNPPYSNPTPWVKKALHETLIGNAGLVAALLPAATDTNWFHDYVYGHSEVRLRRGRIKFLQWDGKPAERPKGGNIIAIYHGVKQL